MASATGDSGAAPVVGSVGHILRGAFSELYQEESPTVGAGAGAAAEGAADSPAQRNDGYESDELQEVRKASGPCTGAGSPLFARSFDVDLWPNDS
jgi:hypothetical protein